MRWLLTIVAIVLILPGGIFFLQGMKVLPSQVMYGKTEWIVIGGAMVLAGAVLIVFTWLRAARGSTGRK